MNLKKLRKTLKDARKMTEGMEDLITALQHDWKIYKPAKFKKVKREIFHHIVALRQMDQQVKREMEKSTPIPLSPLGQYLIIEKMNKNDGFHMAVGTSRGRPTYEESIIGE